MIQRDENQESESRVPPFMSKRSAEQPHAPQVQQPHESGGDSRSRQDREPANAHAFEAAERLIM